MEPIGRALGVAMAHNGLGSTSNSQGAAVTRSEPVPLDCATTAGDGTGVAAAPQGVMGGDTLDREAEVEDEGEVEGEAAAEAVRRELARLTALLRRHFSAGGEDSLLPALADTSDPVAAASARQFLDQIRMLAESLHRDAGRWADSVPAAGAFADFRRETMALLQGVEERLGER